MNPYYQDSHATIYHGDCREILPRLPAADLVLTDPPYSSGRAETEFQATGNIAGALHEASLKAPTMIVFGTSSGRGFEFVRSSIRALPHCRTLVWHRTFTNSPAAGPWRWDLVMLHVFGKGAFGRPVSSGLIQTGGTRALAIETGHKAPVPVEVMDALYAPFAPGLVIDPFMGSGTTILAALARGGRAIGIEIEERYCEIAAKRLSQEVLSFPDETNLTSDHATTCEGASGAATSDTFQREP